MPGWRSPWRSTRGSTAGPSEAEYALGEVELVAGHLEDSQRSFAAALALAEERIGPEDVLTCKVVNGLGHGRQRARRSAGVARPLRACPRGSHPGLGRSAPRVADEHMNIGIVLAGLGRLVEARAAYQAALAIRPRHPRSEARANRQHARHLAAHRDRSRGDPGGARAQPGSVAGMERRFAPRASATAAPTAPTPWRWRRRAAPTKPAARTARFLAIVEKVDPAHPLMIDALEGVAAVEESARRYAVATAALERAAAIAGRVEGGGRPRGRRSMHAWPGSRCSTAIRDAPAPRARQARRLADAARRHRLRPPQRRDSPSGPPSSTRIPTARRSASARWSWPRRPRSARGSPIRGFEDLARFALARADLERGDRPLAHRLATQALAGFQSQHDTAWAERVERWLHER